MKKSLIFWFAAITCAALFLVGCESPTNGESGAAGTDGPYPLTDAAVSAAQLEAAFYVSSRVAITNGSGGIEGEVPAGKTLYVLGSAIVTSAKSLTVKGTLDIYEAAALDASYVSGTAGYLATSGGTITGTGIVSLPYIADGVTDGPTGIVTYGNSPGSITKTAGSYIAVSAAAPGSALNNANLETLMGALPAGASLTVSDITGLTANAVPSGKTLVLAGAGNTVTANLDLAAGGTLIVNGTLEVASGATITGKSGADDTANITVNGTLKLATSSTALTIAGKVDLSGADIDASAAGAATLTLPTGTTGAVREISVGTSNALTIAGVTDTLTVESIGPQNGKGVKSDSVKTYAVKGGGSVGLATAAAAFIVKQAGIVNGTTDTEFVLDDSSGAITIASALTITNAVLKAGTTNGISVTTVTSYPLAEANLAKVKGKVTYDNVGTGAAGSVTIPAGVDIIATAGTLESITGLTVAEGASLSGDALTLAALTTLEVNGELTLGDAVAVSATLESAKVSGTGELTLGTTDFSAAKYAALLNIKNVTSAATTLSAAFTVGNTLTLTGEAAPAENVTVSATGRVIVPTSGSLTIAAGKTLDIAADGVVALTDTGSVVLKGAADTGGAKLTGAGKLTAGKTEIVGGDSGWQAVGASGDITIASVSAVAASIEAASSGVFTAQGAGATITQATGSGNNLTIAANTEIALGTGGAIVLKKQADTEDAAKITLPNTAIIKAGTGDATKAVLVGNLRTGLAANGATGATAGDSITAKAAASGPSTLTQIIGAASDNTVTGPTNAATVDCTINSTLAVTGES